jgi:tRNA modification GTPase
MSTRVSVLTPPGSGAIAVLAVRGQDAARVLRELFRPARVAASFDDLSFPRFWFGRLGDQATDEVILTRLGPDHFEVHCHGGRRVVAWILELLRARAISVEDSPGDMSRYADATAAALLPYARTLRTAAALLDQANGAYRRAVDSVNAGGPEASRLAELLRRNAAVGAHLVEPWRVAIAGPPNAGKSSLLNALAGFDRSVVSPIPGTTRDAVSVSLAFDGWPVDVCDTAGLRDSADEIEREGVDRARAAVANSDLTLWVVDATGPRPASTDRVAESLGLGPSRVLVVLNKMDVAEVGPDELPDAARVSAITGFGVPELAARIVGRLVPHPPAPGDPVPYTPAECARWA